MSGIQARHAGKCPRCLREFPEGTLIDRDPAFEGKRSHVDCIQRNVMPGGTAPAPAASTSAPTTAPLNGATPAVRAALVDAIQATTQIVAWAEALRDAQQRMLDALDSHQSPQLHAATRR